MTLQTQLPPHDIAAEEAMIGSVLIDGQWRRYSPCQYENIGEYARERSPVRIRPAAQIKKDT